MCSRLVNRNKTSKHQYNNTGHQCGLSHNPETSGPMCLLMNTQCCCPLLRPCSPTSPFLVVVVCTSVENYVTRDSIRISWAQVEREQKDQVKVIFLVGQRPDDDEVMEDMLKEESSIHGDILQQDFIDTYVNLTIKSPMLLKWFNQIGDKNNQKPEFVLKTDDDMYINLEKLVQAAMRIRGEKVIMGNIECSGPVLRWPSSKWYCPMYMYAEDFYPPYIFGTAYLVSSSAAQDLHFTALDTPAFSFRRCVHYRTCGWEDSRSKTA